jgi:DNA-binding SARP family transcriptional activator/tetratricopeptide (TPR) repeat protein
MTGTPGPVEIGALGPLELRVGTRAVPLGDRQRLLLADLVVSSPDVVPSDRLIDDVWAGAPPATAVTALQVHVSRLRRLLAGTTDGGPRITTRSPGYLLELPPGTSDVGAFDELVGTGRAALTAGDPEAAVEAFEEAQRRWRGRPLGDLADEPFARAWVARLEQTHHGVIRDRIEAELALGRHGAVLAELDALAVDDPLDERVCALRMVALHRSGRQAEALRACQALRRALASELGIEPGADLRALEDAVLRQELGPAPATARRRAASRPVEPTPRRPERPATAPPFVGRSAELALVRSRLALAAEGDGQIVLVSGEPGAGKTRLVEEVAGDAEAEGARVAWGRCTEGDGSVSFWPWVQVLRDYVRVAGDDELEHTLLPHRRELAHVLPELGGDDEEPPRTERDPDAARFRLFDHMAGALAGASAQAPSVIVLDDLQWADPGSLVLLEFLAERLSGVRATIVGVHRDDAAARRGPLAATLGALARRAVTRVAVGGLGGADIAEYIELTTGTPAPVVAEGVRLRTGGNAFFVREVVDLLAGDGRLADPGEEEDWSCGIPAGVRDVVRRRYLSLPDPMRRVLEAAAVIGTRIRFDVLTAVCDDADLLEAVEALVAADLVREDDDADVPLRFAHDLVREAVYAEQSVLRRARTHQRVGEALEALLASADPPPLAEVARHLRLAGPAGADPARAVEYDVRAAEAATRALGYEDAVAHYERAAANAGRGDPGRRSDLLLALGDARWRTGDGPGARQAFLEAVDLARGLGDPGLLARAVLGFGGGTFRPWHTTRGEANEKLVMLLEEALEHLGAGDEALRVRVLGQLAEQLYFVSSAERRLALTGEAVHLAEELGDPATLASALCSRCLAMWGPELLDERLAITSRLIELGRRLDDPGLWMFGQHHRTLARIERGDLAAAVQALDAYEERAGALRQLLFRWEARVLRAVIALLQGRFADVERIAEEARRMAEQAGEPDGFDIYAAQVGMVLMEHDRIAEVRPLIAAFAEELTETPWWEVAMTFIDVFADRPDEGRARFDRLAADDFTALPRDLSWSAGMAILALVAGELDDERRAAALHRLLEPFADRTAMAAGRGSWGSIAMYLGILAGTTGDHERAEAWFEQAVEANGRMGAAPWVAHTRYHWGRLLLRRGRAADAERATGLLDEAERAATALGMTRLRRLTAEAGAGT